MEKRGVIKVAVVGAESTGKTWLCENLARHYHTVWVPEYAREYFNDSDIYNYTLRDLEVIAGKQIELERRLLSQAREALFCDTTLITLRIWAELEFETVPPFIEEQLRTVSYDLYLITDNTISWQSDPLRQNKHSRDLLLEMNIHEVKKTGRPFAIISGTEEERLRYAIIAVDTLRAAGAHNSTL